MRRETHATPTPSHARRGNSPESPRMLPDSSSETQLVSRPSPPESRQNTRNARKTPRRTRPERRPNTHPSPHTPTTPSQSPPSQAQTKTPIKTTTDNGTDRPEQQYQSQPHKLQTPSPLLGAAKPAPQAIRPPEPRRRPPERQYAQTDNKPATSTRRTKISGPQSPKTTNNSQKPCPSASNPREDGHYTQLKVTTPNKGKCITYKSIPSGERSGS